MEQEKKELEDSFQRVSEQAQRKVSQSVQSGAGKARSVGVSAGGADWVSLQREGVMCSRDRSTALCPHDGTSEGEKASDWCYHKIRSARRRSVVGNEHSRAPCCVRIQGLLPLCLQTQEQGEVLETLRRELTASKQELQALKSTLESSLQVSTCFPR